LAKLLSKEKSFFLNLNDHQTNKIEYFIHSKIFAKLEFLLECGTSFFSDGYLFFIYFQKMKQVDNFKIILDINHGRNI